VIQVQKLAYFFSQSNDQPSKGLNSTLHNPRDVTTIPEI